MIELEDDAEKYQLTTDDILLLMQIEKHDTPLSRNIMSRIIKEVYVPQETVDEMIKRGDLKEKNNE